MNKTNLLYFSLFLYCLLSLCLMVACEDPLRNRTKSAHTTTHSYDDSSSVSSIHKEITIQEKNRWIWQKPELVIEKLGDLQNKTVVDIGAGPYGYFSYYIAEKTLAEKVIAIDIDTAAIQLMNASTHLLSAERRKKFTTRLVHKEDPKLENAEADVILLVNVVAYFSDRAAYFKNLFDGIAPQGRMVIVDFKKRSTPIGPAAADRLAIGELEEDLQNAGYTHIEIDDCTLDYQYIVTVYK